MGRTRPRHQSNFVQGPFAAATAECQGPFSSFATCFCYHHHRHHRRRRRCVCLLLSYLESLHCTTKLPLLLTTPGVGSVGQGVRVMSESWTIMWPGRSPRQLESPFSRFDLRQTLNFRMPDRGREKSTNVV
ncbi:hypothetical protein PoB_003741300 [Plakobranchus ocellatus]|uniref:Uncharacterized protein n=1 Tax=Plakobranchus ocellatus TaxID=259542 RepID=A0AAV4AVP2_9GAST|nr:hypothetical protein PoB_003741300 [Plakobranchus ocellatus]